MAARWLRRPGTVTEGPGRRMPRYRTARALRPRGRSHPVRWMCLRARPGRVRGCARRPLDSVVHPRSGRRATRQPFILARRGTSEIGGPLRPQRRRLGRRPGVELVPGDVSRCVHRGTLGSAAPQDAAGARGDGRAAPETTPTDEILAALRELRERVPNSAAVVDQTIVALEDLRAEVSGLRYALTSRTTIDEGQGHHHGRTRMRRGHRLLDLGADVAGHERSAQRRRTRRGLPSNRGVVSELSTTPISERPRVPG